MAYKALRPHYKRVSRRAIIRRPIIRRPITVVARGWTPASWQAAGHAIDPYIDAFAGGYWTANPYASIQPPVVTVSAAAHWPPVARESAHAPPPGPLQAGTLAHAFLTRWLAPLTANKAPVQTPLLVIGQSAWDSVAKTVEASAGRCYPTTYPRISGTLCCAPLHTFSASADSRPPDQTAHHAVFQCMSSPATKPPRWCCAAMLTTSA